MAKKKLNVPVDSLKPFFFNHEVKIRGYLLFRSELLRNSWRILMQYVKLQVEKLKTPKNYHQPPLLPFFQLFRSEFYIRHSEFFKISSRLRLNFSDNIEVFMHWEQYCKKKLYIFYRFYSFGRSDFIQILKMGDELVPRKDRQSKRGSILPLLAFIPETNLVGNFDADMWEFFNYNVSVVWHYGLSSFQAGNTKLERFLPKNQHTQRRFLNFENWVHGRTS